MKKIVLASASPRRRELLSQVGVIFEVKPASGEEQITSAEPAKVVEELSRQKAMFTACALEEEENRDLKDVVVFGDDTNDEVMFDPQWTSIAMGNATESLKEKADFVTKANIEDGIQYACKKFGWIE